MISIVGYQSGIVKSSELAQKEATTTTCFIMWFTRNERVIVEMGVLAATIADSQKVEAAEAIVLDGDKGKYLIH